MFDMKEMGLLASALVMRNVSFKFKDCNDGWCILGNEWDVAINTLTMGAVDGLLELLDYEEWRNTKNVDDTGAYGYLTASEALELLEEKGLIPKV